MKLFVMPGNPPIVHFYNQWKQEIQNQNNQITVHISKYPILNFESESDKYFEQFIDNVEEEFLAYFETHRKPITLIGHSFGGFLSLKLISRHPEKIKNCVLLYPFLKEPNLRGRIILTLLNNILPAAKTEKFVMRTFKKLKKHIKQLDLVQEREIQIAHQAIYHESKIIAKIRTPISFDKNLSDKIILIYQPQDTWCPERHVQTLANQVPCIKVQEPHDFVISKKHRHSLWETIQKSL